MGGFMTIFLFKLTYNKRKLLESDIKIYLWGKILIEGQDLPIYRRSISNNPKIKEWLLVVKMH
jgi:hypothetical protein